MKVLAIETATPASSVALGSDGDLVAMALHVDSRGHVGFLMSAIDFCFAQAGWDRKDIDVVAVDIGPGPYTGLRAGIAAAQAIAAAVGAPIVTADSLTVLAYRAATGRRRIWPVVDVRRGQFATAPFLPVPGGVMRDGATELVGPAEFVALLDADGADTLIVGDWGMIPDSDLRSLHRSRKGRPRHPSADVLVEIAELPGVPGRDEPRRGCPPALSAGAGCTDQLGRLPRGGHVARYGDAMTAVSAPHVELRPMTILDLDAVVALEGLIYPQPWSRQIFSDELAADQRVYLVAEMDGRLVGYAGLMVIVGDAHITTVAVDPAARRHRVGTRLMLELVERSVELGGRHLTLEVRVSNLGAQRLYTRFGMAPVGVRKDYYIDEDALIMWVTDIDEAEYRTRLDGIRNSLPQIGQNGAPVAADALEGVVSDE